MAFSCLWRIEKVAGGRRQAASRFSIEYDVLHGLGYLVSEVGDDRTGRKPTSGPGQRPHTPAEVAWIEAVVKKLIKRAGEWAADPAASWPLITMGDFPRP